MYLNNLVVAIKKLNGDTLRESNVVHGSHLTKQSTVYLPFNSEYQLFIKNNAGTRAVISISIDGTDVLGGHQLVIPAWSERHIERFILDGDLNKGRRFKFVSIDNPAVQNPKDSQNGLLEITCRWEKPPVVFIPTVWYSNWQPSSASPNQFHTRAVFSNMKGGGEPEGAQHIRCCSMSTLDAGAVSTSGHLGETRDFAAAEPQGQKGATVEGRESRQSFGLTTCGELYSEVTTLRFQILAPASEDVPITVKDTRTKHCTECNQILPSSARFCSACGEKQVSVA